MDNRKLRIGIITNNPVSQKTGLARNVKAWLPLIYETGKYEIFFLSQGSQENDSSFAKMPWKTFGVFKNFDQGRFQQDQNYQRIVAYGNTVVEEFITSNKLDVCVLLDDFWAGLPEFYFNTDWYQHMKQNFMFVATADSEPILPLGKEWAQKCPNMRFWSDFASRVLKLEDEKKYGHCQTIHGAIDIKDFQPLDKQERLRLRRKFGIADDEMVCIYLGRNQLRKIFPANMEALVKFRAKNPNKKMRLLFHCSWSEQMGWPLNQIREQFGLKPEDVLTSYYCQNCGDWHIQPFVGEGLPCNVCGNNNSKITAGVGSLITEADLNKIYNLCDCSSSVFTSGGQEYTNIESLLAGLPLACPNYSCGEDFISAGTAWEIKGTYTWEHNSGFKKFVPYSDSIVEFFEYCANLKDDEREKLVRKNRKWAIDQFNAKAIAKIYEKFFDSCKPIDWEPYFQKRKELKNVNAQVQNIENDHEFVLHCYKTILNMDVDENDSGYKHWRAFLNQNIDKSRLKNEMVVAFRNAAIEHNQKVQPVTLESFLDKDDESRVLLVLKESLGDLYLTTSLLPEIQKKYPKSSIYIGCEQKYFDVFDMNQYVKKCIPYSPDMDNEMMMCGFGGHKGYFNYYHNIGLATQKILSYLYSKY